MPELSSNVVAVDDASLSAVTSIKGGGDAPKSTAGGAETDLSGVPDGFSLSYIEADWGVVEDVRFMEDASVTVTPIAACRSCDLGLLSGNGSSGHLSKYLIAWIRRLLLRSRHSFGWRRR